MAYPVKLLNRNEEIALDLRPHWWYFGRQILTAVPLVIVIALLLSAGSFWGKSAVKLVVGVVVLAWVVWLALKYLAWARTYFVVTNQRVIYRTGVLSRHGSEIPLDRITNINFQQRIFERMIGAGNIEIQSAGEQGNSSFDFVRHPDGVQQEIYRMMEAHAKADTHRGADAVGDAVARALADHGGATPAPSVPEQIQQLAALRDAGHISAEEFEAKKAELLDRM